MLSLLPFLLPFLHPLCTFFTLFLLPFFPFTCICFSFVPPSLFLCLCHFLLSSLLFFIIISTYSSISVLSYFYASILSRFLVRCSGSTFIYFFPSFILYLSLTFFPLPCIPPFCFLFFLPLFPRPLQGVTLDISQQKHNHTHSLTHVNSCMHKCLHTHTHTHRLSCAQ